MPSGFCALLMHATPCWSAFTAQADSLKALLPLSRSDSTKVWIFRDIAYDYLPHEPDSTLHYAGRGAALARSIEFHQGELRNLYQAALAYEYKDQFDSAYMMYRRATNLAKETADGVSLIEMINAHGVARYYAGDLSAATALYTQAFAIADSLEIDEQKSHSLNNIGVIYRLQGKHELALEIYEKSLRLKEAQNDTVGMVNSLYNLGLVHSFMESFAESLEALSMARELSQGISMSPSALAPIELGIGVAYFNLDHPLEARKYLEKGMEHVSKSDPYMLAAAMAYLGIMDVMDGRLDAGMQAIDEAYAYAKSAGRLELLLQIARQRALAAEHTNRFGFMAEAWKEYSILADSLRNRDVQRIREEMESRFELREKELTIALQQSELESELIRKRRTQFIAAIFLAMALGAAGVAFILQKRKKELNAAIASKQQALNENIVLLREMHHRTKNNLQLLQSLFNLYRRNTRNQDAQKVLKSGSDSVEALALLHHHLYKEGDFRKINMKEYLVDLLAYLSSAFSLESRNIAMELDCPKVHLDINQAIPVGIIINELVTNAVKHAFLTRQQGLIEVHVREEGEQLCISIKDNGNGMPESPVEGSGTKLLQLFQRKLSGKIHYTSNPSGTRVELTFPIKTEIDEEDAHLGGGG